MHINLSRCISLYFLSASVALNILSVYHLFPDFENFMSLFGRFQFLAPTCFLEVIYPRYNPDTIIINLKYEKHIHSFMMPFFVWYFFLHCPIHRMKATSCSVQTEDIFKFWICANYIDTISFSFFSSI